MIFLPILLVTLVVLLLLFLWRHGWKGTALCGAVLFVLALVVIEVRFPARWFSPLNLVDPSDGRNDPALATALKRALLDQPSGPLVFDPSFPQLEIVDVQPGSFTEMEARLRRVPGWDLIVLLGPMEDGERAAQDPRITSWWLRRRIAAQWNSFSDIGYCAMLVVRDDAIVATLIVRLMIGDWKDVIVRNP